MRFSIQNITVWSITAGALFGASVLFGIGWTLAVSLLISVVWRGYVDGLRSAGLEPDLIAWTQEDLATDSAEPVRPHSSFDEEGRLISITFAPAGSLGHDDAEIPRRLCD
ncbi:MAG: hypothetical protein AB8B91_16800 [Rubripirellula sp.]